MTYNINHHIATVELWSNGRCLTTIPNATVILGPKQIVQVNDPPAYEDTADFAGGSVVFAKDSDIERMLRSEMDIVVLAPKLALCGVHFGHQHGSRFTTVDVWVWHEGAVPPGHPEADED